MRGQEDRVANIAGGGPGPHASQSGEQRKEKWYERLDCDCVPDCSFPLLSLSAVAMLAPTRPARTRPTAPGRAGMAAIRGYQRWLSPRLCTRCRHTPACSAYGLEAVRRYGLVAGSRLIAGRLERCKAPTPYGTVDPVP